MDSWKSTVWVASFIGNKLSVTVQKQRSLQTEGTVSSNHSSCPLNNTIPPKCPAKTNPALLPRQTSWSNLGALFTRGHFHFSLSTHRGNKTLFSSHWTSDNQWWLWRHSTCITGHLPTRKAAPFLLIPHVLVTPKQSSGREKQFYSRSHRLTATRMMAKSLINSYQRWLKRPPPENVRAILDVMKQLVHNC